MNISQMELEAMGKEAASKYLLEKVPMNETVIKMAEANGLNPHQVARICEAANTDVYSTLWGMTKNGQFTFDMADQEKIADYLGAKSMANGNPGFYTEMDVLPEKISSYLPDEPDPLYEEKQAEYIKLANAIHNVVSEKNYSIKRAEKLLAELEQIEKQAVQRKFELANEQSKAIEDMTAMLKSAAIQGENIAMAYFAGKAAFPNDADLVKEAFTKINSNLHESGITFADNFIKTGNRVRTLDALGNPRSRIIGVDSQHGIIKHLNTIIKNQYAINDVDQARGYIVDKIEKVKDKLVKLKQPEPGFSTHLKAAGMVTDVAKGIIGDTPLQFFTNMSTFMAPKDLAYNTGLHMLSGVGNAFKEAIKPPKPIGANNFVKSQVGMK